MKKPRLSQPIVNLVLLSISYCCIIPTTGVNNGVSVIKGISGQKDVKLSCPILNNPHPNSDKLSFTSVFWLPENDAPTVIGAGAAYNHKKYQYLASTGQLWFKEQLIPENEGVYHCVVRNGSRISSGAIQLLVKRIYATELEEEFWENIVRSGIAAGLALATILSACLVYSCRHKSKPTGSGRAIGPRSGHYSLSASNASPVVEIHALDSDQIINASRKSSNSSVIKTVSSSFTRNTPSFLENAISEPSNSTPSGLAITKEQLSRTHLSNNHRKLSTTSNSRSEGGISLKSLNNASITVTATINNKPVTLTPSESTSTSLVSIGVNTTTMPTPEEVGEGCSGMGSTKSKPGPTIIYITACED